MGTITRLQDILHGRNVIREEQAVAKFRDRPPTGTDERGARIQHRRARFSPPR